MVEVGQVLCIIEAMKLMNEIESDVAGEVVARIAQGGQPVEYGQPLFEIKATVKKSVRPTADDHGGSADQDETDLVRLTLREDSS